MAKITTIGAEGKNKSKQHRVDIIVEFDEPVTQMEAQNIVLQAISEIMFNLKEGAE